MEVTADLHQRNSRFGGFAEVVCRIFSNHFFTGWLNFCDRFLFIKAALFTLGLSLQFNSTIAFVIFCYSNDLLDFISFVKQDGAIDWIHGKPKFLSLQNCTHSGQLVLIAANFPRNRLEIVLTECRNKSVQFLT